MSGAVSGVVTGVVPGVVVVDKPGGMTSHDVVARVRRLAGTRKVGHAGTLDPMATGVLVVGVDRATRLLGHLSGSTKHYAATIRLGASTSTDDAEGEPTGGAPADGLGHDAVLAAVGALTGELDQVPATVSAKKVDGRRAHERVRAGEQVVLEPRRVLVSAFEVDAVRSAPPHLDLDVRVTCSAGTYVRALARDLGTALGVGGHLTALRRTASGPFTLEHARTLDALADDWTPLDLGTVARAAFATHVLDDDAARLVRHGRPLALDLPARDGPVAMLGPAGDLLALYRADGARAVPVAVLVG